MIDFEKDYDSNSFFIKKNGTSYAVDGIVKNIVFTDISTGEVVLTIPEAKIASIDNTVDKISSEKILSGRSFI